MIVVVNWIISRYIVRKPWREYTDPSHPDEVQAMFSSSLYNLKEHVARHEPQVSPPARLSDLELRDV